MIMHKKHQMNLCNFTVLHFLKEENIIKSSDEFRIKHDKTPFFKQNNIKRSDELKINE